MKKYFLFCCLFSTVIFLSAQSSYIFQMDSSKMCYPRDLLFTPSGNLVFCAIAWENNNPYYMNYIYEVNNFGEIVNSWTQFSSSDYSIDCQRLLGKDNFYYLFGIGSVYNHTDTLFVFMKKFDHQLNEIFCYNYYLDNSLYKSTYHASRVVLVDTVFRYYSSANQSNSDLLISPFFLTMSINGEYLGQSHDMNVFPPTFLYDLIEKQEPLEISAFVSTLDQNNVFAGFMYSYDKNLLLKSKIQLPDFLKSYFTSLKLNDSIFYVSGAYREPIPEITQQVGVIKIKTDGTLINHYLFDPPTDSTSFPAYYNSLDFTAGGDLIMCSSYGIIGNFMPQHVPSFICLYKLSPNLDLIWQRYIGGEANYEAYSMRVAPDSGIVILGKFSKVPPLSVYRQEMLVIKTNKDGIITTTGQPEAEIKTSDAILYPNPASEQITVDFSRLFTTATLQLKDISGKTVYQTKLTNNRQTLDISALPAGTYVYRIFNQKGLDETGKLVVE